MGIKLRRLRPVLAITLVGLLAMGLASHVAYPLLSGRDLHEHPVPTHCALCGARVVSAGDVRRNKLTPFKNREIWNQSATGNPIYLHDSVVCTQCSYAYSGVSKAWRLTLHAPDGFTRPLDRSIVRFPLPPGARLVCGPVYTQEYDGASFTQYISVWVIEDADYLAEVGRYCARHHLKLTIYKDELAFRVPGRRGDEIELTASKQLAGRQAR